MDWNSAQFLLSARSGIHEGRVKAEFIGVRGKFGRPPGSLARAESSFCR
ncbi:hypothetical protein LMG29542_07812 [Paraburkholderia humisilvae]|uniref:Uncharacterized protein n=1 Tax=Paraburkholderia humisilvae TaxID=627669 RepID=A0A6J5FB38_9BURK|nr:hypothetical protein LMG29542_07812 [Paraburkholderia humisilvae]